MDKVVRIECQGSIDLPWKEIQDFQGNLKTLSDANYQKLKNSIMRLGFSEPVSVWLDLTDNIWKAENGHQRLKTLSRMEAEGFQIQEKIPCSQIHAANREEAKLKLLSLTSQFGQMSGQGLADFMVDAELKFDQFDDFIFPEIDMDVFKANFVDRQGDGAQASDNSNATVHLKLSDKFIVPPFSVLDAKQGYWQDRKREWLSIGIKSEVGRAENLLGMSETMLEPDPEKRKKMLTGKDYDGGNAFSGSGTSIFDPVLCELAYKWFCPKGGKVLDPFAGGSVRGVVASKCGVQYTGSELRQEQVDANNEQVQKICQDLKPTYICGDSQNLKQHFPEGTFDLIFSCPPYADLEKYSEDARDLSNMAHEDFLAAYNIIIQKSVALLAPNRFCVWVISDIRYKGGGGFYRGLVKDTIKYFEEAGAAFYNDMVLLNAIGTTALRAGRTFSATRKVGRIHQNVLVFCKGDVANAVKDLGEIEVELPPDLQAEA